MKFIQVADIHLGFKSRYSPVRQHDVYRAWKEFLVFCMDNPYLSVLIAGDLFDSNHPPVEAVIHAIKLGQLRNKVYICGGNHDSGNESNLSPLLLLKNFENIQVCLTPMRLILGGESLVASPATNLVVEDKGDILLAHGRIEGPREYTHSKYLRNLDSFRYCALGDLHRFFSKGNVVYSGALTTLTFAQENEFCGFLIVDTDKMQVTQHKVFSRGFRTLSALNEEEISRSKDCIVRCYGNFDQKLLDALRKTALHVTLFRDVDVKTEISNTVKTLEASLGEFCEQAFKDLKEEALRRLHVYKGQNT